MVYTYVFSITAGAVSITFHGRPKDLRGGSRVMVAERSIPGATHSILQGLGANSEKWAFDILIYDLNITGEVGMAPPANEPRDILQQLDAWAKSGTLVTFITDWITQALGETFGVYCLITKLDWKEIAGGEENYIVSMELTRYEGAVQ